MQLPSDLSALPDGFPARVSCVRVQSSRDVLVHDERLGGSDDRTGLWGGIPDHPPPGILSDVQTASHKIRHGVFQTSPFEQHPKQGRNSDPTYDPVT